MTSIVELNPIFYIKFNIKHEIQLVSFAVHTNTVNVLLQ